MGYTVDSATKEFVVGPVADAQIGSAGPLLLGYRIRGRLRSNGTGSAVGNELRVRGYVSNEVVERGGVMREYARRGEVLERGERVGNESMLTKAFWRCGYTGFGD